jgi:hypothetical protein
MAGDDLFGPDGTQALQADALLGDPLGGLVTGGAYAAGGNSAQERAEVAEIRVEVPDAPAAPDQAPLKAAVDKAMMTGPPTNPLRLPAFNAPQPIRPAPTVVPSMPAPVPVARPLAVRQQTVRQVPRAEQEDRILQEARASLAGRRPLRRAHPVVSGLVRFVVGVAIVVVLLILVLRGSGSGGNLSDLFG